MGWRWAQRLLSGGLLLANVHAQYVSCLQEGLWLLRDSDFESPGLPAGQLCLSYLLRALGSDAAGHLPHVALTSLVLLGFGQL